MSSNRVQFREGTVFVVFGASGDLARKKTFPALFGLYREGYLPKDIKVIGYARSGMSDEAFKERISSNFGATTERAKQLKEEFLSLCEYESEQYDKPDGFQHLTQTIEKWETSQGVKEAHRVFYLALPPSMFTVLAENIKRYCHPGKKGVARLVVEKPFGRDLKSARELQSHLAPLWTEDELFRIDHYLGKEMVKNLLPLRFANTFLAAGWNNRYITSVQIELKEAFGTEGRGGYFDTIGIIRDVIQNHLLQVMTLVMMERPVSDSAEAIRDEKVRVLKALRPLDHDKVLVGQYTASEDGTKPGYQDDETVKAGSKCFTYCAMTLEVANERWEGVPIILRAGKALNESKVEIRIQFRNIEYGPFADSERNELVIRVQPDEAMYMKMNAKIPGMSTEVAVTDMDLTYSSRFKDFYIPAAYESLLRDVLNDNHSSFVRDDELEVSWGLFTPLLEFLEGPDGPYPLPYQYGTRGPEPLNAYLAANGYHHQGHQNYQWPVMKAEDTGKK